MHDFSAEILKLCKRKSTWFLGAMLFITVLLFSYVLVYALSTALPAEGGASSGALQEGVKGSATQVKAQSEDQRAQEALLANLLPENLVSSLLPISSSIGGTVSLILGVLIIGSEYKWGTLKTVLAQRSSRATVLLGKLLAAGTALVLFVLLAFGAGFIGSFTISRLEHLTIHWPSIGNLAAGIGALWLVFMTWTTFGMLLAVLFRGSSLAIGVGLIYSLVLESMLAGPTAKFEVWEIVRTLLPGQSSSALAFSFSTTPEIPGNSTFLSPGLTALVLGTYVIGFFLLTVCILRNRDVGH